MDFKCLAWAGVIAVGSTACDTAPRVLADAGASDPLSHPGTGGSPSTSSTPCNWDDAGIPDDGDTDADAGATGTPPGTCPLINATTPVNFSTTPGSPCPSTAPDMTKPESLQCARALLGTRCAYPSTLSHDIEDIWTCTEEGGTLDANGDIVPGSTVTNWQSEIAVCKRTGTNCLIGLNDVCGRTSPRIELTTPCENRTVLNCHYDTGYNGVSKQQALDTTGLIPPECYTTGTGAFYGRSALSVWFKGDCPTSFIVYPPELADCVKTYLESVRLECAAGLMCGATGMTGGCAC